MLQQSVDLQAEAAALSGLLETLPDTDWARPTQFKGWTIKNLTPSKPRYFWLATRLPITRANFIIVPLI